MVDLARENEELRYQLEEAQELIHAIRTGAVDALAVQSAEGPRIFTLQGADQGYRTLIEQMNEGALLLSEDATVLYCNACLAGLLGRPLDELMGSSFDDFVPPAFEDYWASLVLRGWAGKSKGELPLQTRAGALLPFSVSMNVLTFNETPSAGRDCDRLVGPARNHGHSGPGGWSKMPCSTAKPKSCKREEAARLVGERAAAEASRMLEGISADCLDRQRAGRPHLPQPPLVRLHRPSPGPGRAASRSGASACTRPMWRPRWRAGSTA